jgi:hypothetical protein
MFWTEGRCYPPSIGDSGLRKWRSGTHNLECHRFENTSVLAANISVILTSQGLQLANSFAFPQLKFMDLR